MALKCPVFIDSMDLKPIHRQDEGNYPIIVKRIALRKILINYYYYINQQGVASCPL